MLLEETTRTTAQHHFRSVATCGWKGAANFNKLSMGSQAGDDWKYYKLETLWG